MSPVAAEPDGWLLAWARSTRPVPELFHPLADRFANIEQIEARLNIVPGTPILISPSGNCDIRLSRFFSSPHFSRLRSSTKKSYAGDLRMWIEYLDSRGKDWSQATADDVTVYWLWRTRADLNEDAVGGSKANRELAAISLLYRWAAHPSRGYVAYDPIERETLTLPEGRNVDARSVRSKNVVRERVRWLTPRTVRLWREIGIEGYTIDRLRDDGFKGRTVSRNKAMVELLYGSGLRITEASSLLLPELPPSEPHGSFAEAQLSAAIAKGGFGRTWYLLNESSALTASYIATSRRAAIEGARRRGVYESLPIIEVSDVEITPHQVRYKFGGKWHDHHNVGIETRKRLFIDNGNGPEPLWLWLNEAGTPIVKDSWTDVFDAANHRVAQIFKAARNSGRLDRNAGAPRLSPHSLRHSFALYMLIALHWSIDQRRGTHHVTDYNEERYREAWEMVRDLLGHASVVTTQNCYLAPLNGIRLRSLIDGPDLKRALQGLSRLDPSVVDVAVLP